ncbi:MAG: hypothetical protein PHY09_14870 [Desulfuromonadaceae bacterium]|nr:hypothetical protein [Desulfuromonadaceae bacterium]MDD5106024.1 hypothetical protein [Desulfuromonadaceae bacterium]
MHETAATVGSKQNMIQTSIRRFNAAVTGHIMRIRFRSIGATLLGGFAGLSLTANVIPSAMQFSGATDSFSARWDLGGFAVYSMMAWAVGGWAVQKTGDKKMGAIILGLVGMTTGLFFTGIGIGTQSNLLLTGGGAALLYGAIGGMIIGDALRNPSTDFDKSTASIGRIGDLALFRYYDK